MYLYRATGDPYLLEVGEDILKSIQYSARTSCGYATIKNVKDHRKQDTMESFFLAETTKYLFLLFDPDNFLNSDGGYGTVIETQNGECIIESSYVFNTEAHPIDVGALRCCYDVPRESLVKGFNRKKYLGETTEKFDEPLKPVKLEEDPQSTEELKKALVDEIMSALTNVKKKIEENVDFQKRFMDIKNREKDESFNYARNVIDLVKTPKGPDEQIEEIKSVEHSAQQDVDNEADLASVETVKLSSEELDSENLDTSSTSAGIDEDPKEEIPSLKTPEGNKDVRIITKPVIPNNNSILTDFVQAILKTTSRKVNKFDPQQLLEKIKENKYPRNESWTDKYELLTCKAQPYIQRISVMGEFY